MRNGGHMLNPTNVRVIIPPIISIIINTENDIVIARDTARRLAAMVGETPLMQARFSTIASEITRLLLKTCQTHRLDFYRIEHQSHQGLQLSCEVDWLHGVCYERVVCGLQQKLGQLADDIQVHDTDTLTFIGITILQEGCDEKYLIAATQ